MNRSLLLLLALTLRLAGQEDDLTERPSVYPKGVEESLVSVVEDDTGRVWGWCSDHPGFSMVHLGKQGWVHQKDPAPPGAQLQQLEALSDGSVAAVWNDRKGVKTFLSIHRGDQPPRVSSFPGRADYLQILLRSNGALLLTDRSSKLIVEISPKNEARLTLIPEIFFRPLAKPTSERSSMAPIFALEDGGKRVWIWSRSLNLEPCFGLYNFLEYKDGELTRREVPGLDPESDISAMVSHDASHLWYAKMGAGIYSLDLQTMRSELITRPLPVRNGTDNVEYIEKIYCVGQERFALTCPRPTVYTRAREDKWFYGHERMAVRYYNETERCGRLLRYRAGDWEEIISGVDLRPRYGWLDRPLLMTPAGLLLGSYESGPWLALRPGGKPPVQHDWETGFPLPEVYRFIAAGRTHFRTCDGKGAMRVLPIEPAREPATRRQVSVLRGVGQPLRMDSKGNGWGFREEGKVSKWDGAQWTDLIVPKEVAVPYDHFRWWIDDRDQGWYLTKEGPAAILNLATSQWKVYESWEAAAQAQLPRAPLREAQDGMPIYSARGQIAFIKRGDGLHYFNGKVWKWISLTEFPLPINSSEPSAFFRNGHALTVHAGRSDYEYDDQRNRWVTWTDENHWFPGTGAANPIPEGCPLKELNGMPIHALGTAFLLSMDNRLYKAVPGKTVPVFPKDTPSPLAYGNSMGGVEIDAKGGVLLLIDRHDQDPLLSLYYHVPATMPVPVATARLVEQAGPARVEVGIEKSEPPTSEEVWFSWSLDDSPWHAVQQERAIVFKDLPDGPHRLQVRAYNAELGTQRTPTVVEWQKGNDPDAPAKQWIAGFEREGYAPRFAALRGLRDIGAAALPVLRAAKSKLSKETIEWVEKSIAQIESDLEREASVK